ncbi:MAG: tetratricopeptide repeat protein [Bacteroidetes bacterium]|nr:tetratricopeptide repeat protein [Bacteroidota bacterium]
MANGDSEKAKENFNLLLKEFPGSQYAKRSQLNIALVYYNNKQDELALAQFKKVIGTYPGTPEAAEALNSVKNIYISNGKPDDYFAYVKNIPNASVSTGAQDSITYEAAEQRYLKGNFDDAARDFDKYLTQFPNGAYKLNATFYKAECDYRNKNYSQSLTGYENIISEPANIYTEKSLAKAAALHYNGKEYTKAITYFLRLEATAELRENVLAAQTGLMRSYYSQPNYNEAIAYAKKLINGEKVSNDIVSEAHLTYGRSAL